ncbi:MAG: ATP-binding cassette domain-containing protein, partial [Ruminococcus sp.]|nr:ATP-binding cassette domain-containing protein [Ruminococcus sp.]
RNLSKGYRQRVGLAQALINNPPVLILDEPTVGLDPNQIIEIRTLIKKLGKSHTVILSSHILPEIQAVCDRIIIINKGVVAADGTADEIARNITNEHKMTLRIEGSTHTAADKQEIVDAIKSIGGIKYVRADMERERGIYDYDVEADEKTDVRRAINDLCRQKGWNILMLQLSDLTLEDIFLKITMGDGVEQKKPESAPKIELSVKDGELIASTGEAKEQKAAEADTETETSASKSETNNKNKKKSGSKKGSEKDNKGGEL